jgi:hypothetical protein
MKRQVILGASLLVVMGMGAVCEGGIVVKKNGEVFWGDKIKQVNSETLVLVNPRGESGSMTFHQGEVRWYDEVADELTDDYFRKHLDDKLLGN